MRSEEGVASEFFATADESDQLAISTAPHCRPNNSENRRERGQDFLAILKRRLSEASRGFRHILSNRTLNRTRMEMYRQRLRSPQYDRFYD